MSRRAKWSIVFLALLPGMAYLAYKPEDPLQGIDRALGDRAYSDAVKLIEKEIEKAPAHTDILLLKLATAQDLNGDHEKAIASLDRLIKEFPKSDWVRKARFRKSQSYAAMKKWQEAQEIAGSDVRYLVSNDRKMELAGIYLKYANESFKPSDPEKKPDYEKARVFFEKALGLGITGEKAEDIRYQIGVCWFKVGNFDETVKRLDTFTKDHPKSKWAAKALFQLGQARANKGETVRARIHFRDLLADYPDADEAAAATYEIAKTYGIPNPGSDEALELGIKALREFVKKYPDHEKALRADFEIGQSYNNRGRADQAVEELKRFIREHAETKDDILPEAKILVGHILRGQKSFDEAIDTWTAYLKAHPTHNQWDNIQREIITTRFQIAEDLLSRKKYADAGAKLREFLVQYPIDSRAPQAAFLLGMIDYYQEEYDKAITQWEKVVSKYAGQEYAKRARYQIAYTYEQKKDDLAKAYEVYKKSAEEDKWGEGQRRFNQLRAKQITVVTERILGTDEKPVIRITARNVEKLKLSAYKINMETYFRRHYRFEGVDKLDITLIEPDERWEHEFKDYEKYRLYDTQVEVPVKGPGVWAINVTDEDMEATTMFVVSDLALITKSTKKEVFAFAQNTRTKKVYSNAEILVSDGNKVIASGKTDEQGVFHEKIKELKDAGQARFFAVDGSQYASTDLNIGDLAYVEELQPKAYIFTDKPAYRPGQLVHVAAIVRKAKDGQYSFEKGEEYLCDLVSARGDLVERRSIELDEFGMVHADFALASHAPLGNYQVRLYQEKGPSFTGAFRVDRYKLENIQLKVDLPQTVYLRGDKVKGKIIAKYYYGEPVQDHKVVYEVPGFFIREARSDDKGEVEFEFETREFVESQVLQLNARLPEDNLAQSKPIWIATRALNLAVSTMRGVYLAGEKFDVEVKSTDLAGEKTTATVEVHVVKLEVVEGRETEKELDTKDLKITSDEGEGRVAIEVADGGNYILRAEAKDRFGTPVSAEKRIFVSGDKDTVLLRILSDRQSFKVGEEATVDMVCRTTDTVLGLVTYEADGILDYEIKTLKKGQNPYKFRMEDDYAPNMVLAVAAVCENKFFSAEKDFMVSKGLTIELKTDQEAYEPGTEVEVSVKAYDQEGKPARAQIVLGLVDQALFALYGDALPDIRAFFYGAHRGRSVRTNTSATFAYRPGTKKVLAALREEEERLREETVTATAATGLPSVATQPQSVAFLPEGTRGGIQQNRERYASAQDEIAGQLAVVNGPAVALNGLARAPVGGFGGGAAGFGAYGIPQSGQLLLGTDGRGTEANRRGGLVQQQLWAAFPSQGGMGQVAQQLDAGIVYNVQHGGQFQSYYSDFDANGSVDYAFGWGDNGRVDRGFALNAEGVWAVRDLRTSGGDDSGVDRAGELTARTLFLELAYWNPTIVTDEKGEAKVKVRLPDNMTTWKMRARGATAKTVVGDGSGSLVSKRDFFVDLKLPQVVTEGNKLRMGASVHNLSDKDREVALSVHTTVGEEKDATTKKITVKAHSTETVPFEREIVKGDSLRIEAEANVTGEGAGAANDKVVRAVPVRPWGIEVRESKGGSAHASVAVTLRLPTDRDYTNRTLEVSVGPVIEHALFDLPPMGMGGANATLASQVLANAALVDYLARTGDRDTERYRTTLATLKQAAGQLASSRRNEGDWAFAGTEQNGDVYVSSLALRALGRARQLGVTVSDETMAKATAALKNAYQKLPQTANAQKADLLYTLAIIDQADFTHVNRLYRSRNTLDSRSLALVTLTLAELDREPMAREVAEVLAGKGVVQDEALVWQDHPRDFPWSNDPLETTALAVRALARVGGHDEQVEKGIAWLLSRKAAHPVPRRWASLSNSCGPMSSKGVAAMTEAFVDYYAKAKPAANEYTLEIAVNDTVVRKLAVSGSTKTLAINVPDDLVAEKANRIDLRFDGRGEYAYSCVLSGFTRDFAGLNGKAPEYQIERYYEPAYMVFDGKTIPRGFGVARNYRSFRNKVTELPTGQYTKVHINVGRRSSNYEQRYFVVTEPIPEGCTVLANSVRGDFEHHEIGDGEITFYLGERYYANIYYDLYGYVPGQFKILPTQLRNAYEESDLFLSPTYDLAVLPPGEESKDEYKMTPDEYYNLGLRVFEKKDYERANELLETLLTGWELDPKPYEQTVETLLAANIERSDPSRIVKYFEIIYEKYPTKQLTFEQILRVARAYEELREHERAYQVYRGMAESSFLKEANISGELRKQGEFLAAVDFLHDLIHNYPDLEVVQQSLYSLSQLMYQTANKPGDYPELKEKKITKETLLSRTIELLDEYIANYPENPTVEEAAFSMANAYLDLEASDDVVALCRRFQKRYPESSLLDGYQYVEAYGHFINGRYGDALALCKKVSTDKYRTPDGSGQDFSDNRDLAIYIMGQIFHAQAKPVEAIEEYDRVKDKFADAREAIDYFKEKHLEMPEVAGFKTAEQARVDVKYRNVKELELRAFRVDLMKLYLTRRNLNNIADVDLAGVEPYAKKTVALGEGLDYMDKKTSVPLDLKEKGAFLIMAKGDELNRSSMILRGDIGIDVQEDPASGRVRANVYKRASKLYLSKAHVKVIGEGNQDFVTGDTDLRGVFVADDIKGKVTVIARFGDEYAFYRGELPLQGFRPTPPPAPTQQERQEQKPVQAGKRANLRENLDAWNFKNQGDNASYVLNNIMTNSVEQQEINRVKF